MMQQQVTPDAEWADRLRANGLRVTAGRLAALRYLEQHPHSSVASICGAIESEIASISQQSVHNIAHDLTDRGLLRRIDLPGSGSTLYETRTRDNHHHVQCVVCHRVEDVDCEIGAAPCIVPEHVHGMRLLEADVTFRGVCADCETADCEAADRDTADRDTAGIDQIRDPEPST